MAKMSKNERITQKTYDLVAEDWMKYRNNPEYWREEFGIFSRMTPAGRILDIGCGGGRDYPFFRDGGYDYVGLDFSTAFLAKMHESFPTISLVNANMRSIPDLFKKDFFDGFWAAASLLHIEKKDIREVLRGIKRVIVPNGVGFVSIKEGDGEGMVADRRHKWQAEDRRFFAYYRKLEFSSILKDCGITPILIRRRQEGSDLVWLEFFVRCLEAQEIKGGCNGQKS